MTDTLQKFHLSQVWFVLFFALVATSAVSSTVTLPDFTELVDEYSPSVVKIGASSSGSSNPHGGIQQDVPEIFRDFFFGDVPGQRSRPRRASGSGFLVSDDGYILTNNHVIEGADTITVWKTDRTQYDAVIVGVDPRTDLALLKIEGEDFPHLELGNSDDVKVGEWVLAIGSPFNLDYSVTAGIVSAMGRNIGENYVPFIQTDVAINPGNSGGPLFNLDGKVIGINSQIYSNSGGFMGVSFAIPSNLVVNVFEQLKENGRVARGWLGVLIQNIDQDLAESFGLDKPTGALVSEIVAGGPADEGGILPGDIILEFEGKEITSSAGLPPAVGRVQPGTKVELLVLRDGKETTIKMEIGELPDEGQLAGRINPPATQADNALNLVVVDLTEKEKEELGENGVKVTVVEEGPGADAGVQQGDVITMIGSRRIDDVDEFKDILDRIPKGRAFALRLLRNGSPMFLPVRIN